MTNVETLMDSAFHNILDQESCFKNLNVNLEENNCEVVPLESKLHRYLLQTNNKNQNIRKIRLSDFLQCLELNVSNEFSSLERKFGSEIQSNVQLNQKASININQKQHNKKICQISANQLQIKEDDNKQKSLNARAACFFPSNEKENLVR